MMSTLPGLPMFGHGQIEGFTEKYGMEYRWPRYEENPDQRLVDRHQREVAPLLKRRWLFAESSNFLLYDFFHAGGSVDENVFAYSNRNGDERALVVYNNRYGSTRGTIDYSAAYADKGSGQLRQQRLRDGLGVGGGSGVVLAFRDSLTGLEYLRRANNILDQGLTLDLHAYQCHVFLDWRPMHSTAQYPWDRLSDFLNGRGVPNLEDALISMELRPVHDALRRQLDPAIVRIFADRADHPRPIAPETPKTLEKERSEFFDQAWALCEIFLRAAQAAYIARLPEQDRPSVDTMPADPGLLAAAFRKRLRAAMHIPATEALFPAPWTAAARRMLPSPSPQLTATAIWGPILAWCTLELLAESIDLENPERVALDLFDRLRLREPFARAFQALGFEGEEGWRVAARIKVVLLAAAGAGRPDVAPQEPELPVEPESSATTVPKAPAPKAKAPAAEPLIAKPQDAESQISGDEKVVLAPALWLDPDVRWLTGVHEAEGHAYLVREQYEELLWWLLMPSLLRVAAEPAPSRALVEELSRTVEDALASAEAAGYRIDALLEIDPVSDPATSSQATKIESPAAEGNSRSIDPKNSSDQKDAKTTRLDSHAEKSIKLQEE